MFFWKKKTDPCAVIPGSASNFNLLLNQTSIEGKSNNQDENSPKYADFRRIVFTYAENEIRLSLSRISRITESGMLKAGYVEELRRTGQYKDFMGAFAPNIRPSNALKLFFDKWLRDNVKSNQSTEKQDIASLEKLCALSAQLNLLEEALLLRAGVLTRQRDTDNRITANIIQLCKRDGQIARDKINSTKKFLGKSGIALQDLQILEKSFNQWYGKKDDSSHLRSAIFGYELVAKLLRIHESLTRFYAKQTELLESSLLLEKEERYGGANQLKALQNRYRQLNKEIRSKILERRHEKNSNLTTALQVILKKSKDLPIILTTILQAIDRILIPPHNRAANKTNESRALINDLLRFTIQHDLLLKESPVLIHASMLEHKFYLAYCILMCSEAALNERDNQKLGAISLKPLEDLSYWKQKLASVIESKKSGLSALEKQLILNLVIYHSDKDKSGTQIKVNLQTWRSKFKHEETAEDEDTEEYYHGSDKMIRLIEAKASQRLLGALPPPTALRLPDSLPVMQVSQTHSKDLPQKTEETSDRIESTQQASEIIKNPAPVATKENPPDALKQELLGICGTDSAINITYRLKVEEPVKGRKDKAYERVNKTFSSIELMREFLKTAPVIYDIEIAWNDNSKTERTSEQFFKNRRTYQSIGYGSAFGMALLAIYNEVLEDCVTFFKKKMLYYNNKDLLDRAQKPQAVSKQTNTETTSTEMPTRPEKGKVTIRMAVDPVLHKNASFRTLKVEVSED